MEKVTEGAPDNGDARDNEDGGMIIYT